MDRGKKESFCHPPASFLKNRIALTTGDPKSIGRFVISEALKKTGPQKNFQFLVWTEKQSKTLKIPKFQTASFKTGALALQSPFKESQILQVKSSKSPGDWVEEAARFCLKKKLSALITGPVSKKTIKKNRLKALSQTSLLKKLCKKKNVFMCFRGTFFNTVLFSDHIPLKDISLEKRPLKTCLSLALKSRSYLKPSLQNKPLGLLALNPHAGEAGLIGKEEQKILKPLLSSFSSKEVQGPLCPDSAFLKKNWEKYSFFIALYHDQGLIPFKMAHSHTGFTQTLGLPFLRLGVDHGTGLGLKKEEISSASFLTALKEVLKRVPSSL